MGAIFAALGLSRAKILGLGLAFLAAGGGAGAISWWARGLMDGAVVASAQKGELTARLGAEKERTAHEKDRADANAAELALYARWATAAAAADAAVAHWLDAQRHQTADLLNRVKNAPTTDLCLRSPAMRIYYDGLRASARDANGSDQAAVAPEHLP
jgi:hypothetical protein